MIQANITTPLNKSGLAEAVAIELGISIPEGIRAVDAVLNVVTRTVTAGHSVSVTNFGTWLPVQRPARLAFNPRAGEHVALPARQALKFRQSPRLREVVEAADPAAATIRKNPKTPRAQA